MAVMSVEMAVITHQYFAPKYFGKNILLLAIITYSKRNYLYFGNKFFILFIKVKTSLYFIEVNDGMALWSLIFSSG